MTSRYGTFARTIGMAATLLFACITTHAATITVGSYTSVRPFTGSDYDNIRAGLLNPANFGPGGINSNSVVIAPNVNAVNAGILSGYEVFVLSEVASLAGGEAAALAAWVGGGGRLLIVTESGGGGAGAGNAVLSLLDGSSITGGSFGVNDANGGSILAAGLSSDGLFGNLVGGTFGTSLGNALIAGGSSTILGTSNGTNFLMETYSGSGAVLTAADVLFMDFFVPPASLFPNANNAALFYNFMPSGIVVAVAEPGALALFALGLAGLAAVRRRRQ